ncbi:MAG: hypothetical protein ABI056_07195 [Caulobacteraceae bacterium]
MVEHGIADHARLAPPWRIGVNVPWSTAWSGETAFALRPSTLFPGMTEISQIERSGVGEPNFAAVHIDRQRRGLADALCHVCGLATTPGDRWMFPVASGGFVTLHDGQIGWGCNVPPMHEACARRAADLCPRLGRLAEQPVRAPAEEGRLIWRTDVVPGMEALAATIPAGVQAVFSCYRLYSPAAARQIERTRADWESGRRKVIAPDQA